MGEDVKQFVLEMDKEMSKKSFKYFFVDVSILSTENESL